MSVANIIRRPTRVGSAVQCRKGLLTRGPLHYNALSFHDMAQLEKAGVSMTLNDHLPSYLSRAQLGGDCTRFTFLQEQASWIYCADSGTNRYCILFTHKEPSNFLKQSQENNGTNKPNRTKPIRTQTKAIRTKQNPNKTNKQTNKQANKHKRKTNKLTS